MVRSSQTRGGQYRSRWSVVEAHVGASGRDIAGLNKSAATLVGRSGADRRTTGAVRTVLRFEGRRSLGQTGTGQFAIHEAVATDGTN